MRRPSTSWAPTALAALPLLLVGCRDSVDPFIPDDRPGVATGSSWRLTYSPVDDRAPSWGHSGDTLFYHRPGTGALPPSPGVLVAVPFRGGEARPALPAVQTPGGVRRRLAAPALSPDGARIAFAELSSAYDRNPCGSGDTPPTCSPLSWTSTVPMIRKVVLRARVRGSTGPPEDDPGVDVDFDGRRFDRTRAPEGVTGTHVIEVHPFHTVWREEGTPFHRTSWSPDGSRIVFSDGLRLHLWTPGEGGAAPVPGTDDGVSPAWSPDGGWIAFTRLERLDSRFTRCEVVIFGFPVCAEEQTVWEIGRRTLTLVSADGSRLRALGPGQEPAWGPDGATLYYRREGRLWRVRADGTGAGAIPGTDGGRDPAVSPDGRHLAFARQMPDGQHDLFVVRIGGAS